MLLRPTHRLAIPRQLLPCNPKSRSFTHSTISHWGPSPSSRPLLLSSLPIDIEPSIAHALASNFPVVALESTLITHGLPPPYSYDLPLACEELLRAKEVVPATIALLGGRIKVGLTPSELEYLSERGFESRKNPVVAEKLWKVGRREIGAALVKGLDGGTTVSATMAIASLVGIKVFSTGGIGGVHRGAETSELS